MNAIHFSFHFYSVSFIAGVETTVDRSSKNNRIMKWIKQGAERSQSSVLSEDDIEEEVAGVMNALENVTDDLEDLDIDRVSPD